MSLSNSSSRHLKVLLEMISWRHLNGIAWHSKFSYHHKQSRKEFVARLAPHLSKPTITRQLLDSLSDSAKELLKKVLVGEGYIQATTLFALGGRVRSLVYKRVANAPWRDPQNDSEALVYRGFLLPCKDAEDKHYVIAHQLLPTLQLHLLPPPPLVAENVQTRNGPLSHLEALRHDLFVFLLYCQKHLPKALKGRRLRITVVRHLASQLAEPLDVSNARSLTQVPRLWLVTHLALEAELLSISNGHFAPTPITSAWLSAPVSQQVVQLWANWTPLFDWPPSSWEKEARDQWMITPDLNDTWPIKLANLPQRWVDRGTWESQAPTFLRLTEVGELEPPGQEVHASAERFFTDQLLAQLTALGVVEIDESGEAVRQSRLGALFLRLRQSQLRESLPLTAPLSPCGVRGCPEMAHELAPLLPSSEPPPWKREGERLLIPWPPSFPTIWRVAPFVNLLTGGATLEFELSGETVALGLSRSFPLAGLRHALSEGGLSFTRDLLPEYPAPHVRQAIWLETSTPMQMHQLRQERAMRYALRGGKSLDPRRYILDPRYLGSLQKTLLDLGQPAIFDIPLTEESEPLRHLFDELSGPPSVPLPHSAFLLLAVRLWQREMTRFDKKYPRVERTLPYIPIKIVEALTVGLTPLERASIEQIWRETLEKIDPSDEQRPPVVAEADDGIRHLAPLQQAIDRTLPIRITYEAAGKEASIRVVEPHYLEKRRHLWYLHAYCRQAQDNRQFRLDRIRQLTTLPKGYAQSQ